MVVRLRTIAVRVASAPWRTARLVLAGETYRRQLAVDCGLPSNATWKAVQTALDEQLSELRAEAALLDTARSARLAELDDEGWALGVWIEAVQTVAAEEGWR